jgi:hypothetical protein
MEFTSLLAVLSSLAFSYAAPSLATNTTLAARQDAGDKLVFAHFMVGIFNLSDATFAETMPSRLV